jgi:hypothetical protein
MAVTLSTAPLYIRTPRGRMVAFDGASKYRAELKNALLAIDGKTPTHALMSALGDLGNPSELLAELESDGLIEAKSMLQRLLPRTEADNEIWGAPSSSFFGSALDNMLPNSGYDATAPAPLTGAMAAPSYEKVTENLVHQITDSMSSFILVHLPQYAFDVLGELERVRTVAQLRQILPSYAAMAEAAGAEGHGHLRKVREFIAQRF